MLKKKLALLLAAIMLVTPVLASCSDDDESSSEKNTTKSQTTQTTATTNENSSETSENAQTDTSALTTDDTDELNSTQTTQITQTTQTQETSSEPNTSENTTNYVTSEDTTEPMEQIIKNENYSNFSTNIETSYLFITSGRDLKSEIVKRYPGVSETKYRFYISSDGGQTYPQTTTAALTTYKNQNLVITSIESNTDGNIEVKAYPIEMQFELQNLNYASVQDGQFSIRYKSNSQAKFEARVRRADKKPIENFDSGRVKFYSTIIGSKGTFIGTFDLRYLMYPGDYVIEIYVGIVGGTGNTEVIVATADLKINVNNDMNPNRDLNFMCYVISPDGSAPQAQLDFIYEHFWKVYPIMYYAYCDGYTNNTPKVMYIEVKNKDSNGSDTYAPAAMSGNTIGFNQKWSANDPTTYNADCMTHELAHAIQAWGGFPHTEPFADYMREVYGMHYNSIPGSKHENWGADAGTKANPQRLFYIWLCYEYNSVYGSNIVQDIFRRIKDTSRSDYIPSEGWSYTMLEKYTGGKNLDTIWTEFTNSNMYKARNGWINLYKGMDLTEILWDGPFEKDTYQDYLSEARIPLPEKE